ncbi:MAG: hypothetical protein GWP75_02385, partial [Planctomycetia bacterium]|nr:hypothetical protein [Planctomycetia bacterium]
AEQPDGGGARLHKVTLDESLDCHDLDDAGLRAALRAQCRFVPQRAAAVATSPFSSAAGGFSLLDVLDAVDGSTMRGCDDALAQVRAAFEHTAAPGTETPRWLAAPSALALAAMPRRHAQRALSLPVHQSHQKTLLTSDSCTGLQKALLRSCASLGGHEWLEAVPSHDDMRVEPVPMVHALRMYMGLESR